MTGPANVTSIEALHQFRGALIRFAEDVTAIVDNLRQEVSRTLEWIQTDRPVYWREQVRLGFDGVARARSRLEIAEQRMMDGQGPACIEEKSALRKAKAQLQFAQEQVHVVRRWAVKLQSESDDYRSRLGHLDGFLKRDLPRMIAKIQKMGEALDRYAESLPYHDSTEENPGGDGQQAAEATPRDVTKEESTNSQDKPNQEVQAES